MAPGTWQAPGLAWCDAWDVAGPRAGLGAPRPWPWQSALERAQGCRATTSRQPPGFLRCSKLTACLFLPTGSWRAAHPVLPFQGCPHLPMTPGLSHSEATLPGSWGQTTGHSHGSPLQAWRPPCSATGRPHPGPTTSLQGGALEGEVSPVSATQGSRGQRAPPRAVAGVPRKVFLPPALTQPPPSHTGLVTEPVQASPSPLHRTRAPPFPPPAATATQPHPKGVGPTSLLGAQSLHGPNQQAPGARDVCSTPSQLDAHPEQLRSRSGQASPRPEGPPRDGPRAAAARGHLLSL